MSDRTGRPSKGPGWPQLLLAAAFTGFFCLSIGYHLGYRSHSDYAIYPERAVPLLRETGVYPDTETAVDPASSVYPININFADAETLQLLPGIGPERAEAIIAYREEHGIFVTKEELLNVPGIGEGILADIEDLIYLAYQAD